MDRLNQPPNHLKTENSRGKDIKIDRFEAIRNVKEIFRDYGGKLKQAYEDKNVQVFYDLARKAGYNPIEVNLGEIKVVNGGKEIPVIVRINGLWQNAPLYFDNTVRIGPNKELWVGTERNSGKVYNLKHLQHDVGACLLGGKTVRNNEASHISFQAFNEVTMASSQKPPMTENEIKSLLELKHNTTDIEDTILLDALVRGKVEFHDIRYMPVY